MWQNQYNKLKDGLTSFLMLNVLEAKIFPYDFPDQHNAWQNNHYWLSTQRNAVAIMATEPDFFVALVAKNKTGQHACELFDDRQQVFEGGHFMELLVS